MFGHKKQKPPKRLCTLGEVVRYYASLLSLEMIYFSLNRLNIKKIIQYTPRKTGILVITPCFKGSNAGAKKSCGLAGLPNILETISAMIVIITPDTGVKIYFIASIIR